MSLRRTVPASKLAVRSTAPARTNTHTPLHAAGIAASGGHEPKATSTTTPVNSKLLLASYDPKAVEDAFIPCVQSTQLSKLDEMTAAPYHTRLLAIMKTNGLNCQPVLENRQLVLNVDGSIGDIIICTEHNVKEDSTGRCQCNRYYPPEFEILGSTCHFCNHSMRLHRLRPDLEPMVFDETKSEADRKEYQHWFEKFIELQRVYCSAKENFPYDKNLFIEIYEKPRQAMMSFIQSPNCRYVLVTYVYDSVYDEGEHEFSTRYQILSLQTMRPVRTSETLQHGWSCFRDGDQMESGFRTIVWDMNASATLIATAVKNLQPITDRTKPSFVEKIVRIVCPTA